MASPNEQDILRATRERLFSDHQAAARLMRAAELIGLAVLDNRASEEGVTWGREQQAFVTESLEHLVRRQGLILGDRAHERARQFGWQVAFYDIVPIARESGDEPIAWITGNAYMPPLRSLGDAESVWQLDDPGLWEAFVEGLERKLDDERVLMEAPEYDNALYVVDLNRFEHVDDEDRDEDDDSLSGEWRAR